MSVEPTTAMAAGLEGLVIAAALLLLGWLVISAITAKLPLDATTRVSLTLAGLGFFVLALMLLHIFTGGLVFREVWIVPSVVAITIGVLGITKFLGWRAAGSPRPGRAAVFLMLGLLLVGITIWGVPAFRAFPINFGADTAMHSAYAAELMKGETTPSASITGQIPNAYPWLFHATLATTARLTPGAHAVNGLAPLEFVLVGGTVLALFGLGRAIAERLAAGGAVALLAGLTGGFGYFVSPKPSLVYSPRSGPTRFWGDFLFVRSFNPSFYQLVPPFPRDLAFSFLVCALTFAVVGLRKKSFGVLVLGGATLGMASLSNGEAFFVGMGTFVLISIAGIGMPRFKTFIALVGAALTTYLIWFVPQMISYVQLGGYVNLTVVSLVSLPLWATIASWGMITPLALAGLPLWLRRTADPGGKVLAILLLVTLGFVVMSTLLPGLLGHALMALLRAHRYWPLFAFALAIYAGLGGVWLVDHLKKTWMKSAAWAVIFGLCIPSPILTGIALQTRWSPNGLITKAVSGDKTALLSIVSRRPGACVAAAPKGQARRIWTYTGYRMVFYSVGTPHPGNEARIRWAGIYQHIVPQSQRMHDNYILTHGNVSHDRWEAIVKKYGVDIVITPDYLVPRGTGFPDNGIRATDTPYTVFRTGSC